MYTEIKLEKGLYNLTGKSFMQALEAADPSADYEGTPLAGLDAFERQLKRFDIRISGDNCDKVEKFFETTESAVLFPEFVRRAVAAGMKDSALGDIIAVRTVSGSSRYCGYTVTETPGYDTVTPDGTALPETSIIESDEAESLAKFGRLITASYETVKQQRLDVFALTLRSIGKKLADAIMGQAVSVLSEDSDSIQSADTAFAFGDITTLFGSFGCYDMNAVIVSPKTAADIISMEQFRESVTVDEKGNVVLPFGTKLIKSAGIDNDTIIGIDSRYALEFVTNSDLVMEADKLISRQMDAFTVSCSLAFRKLMSGAVKVLNLKKSS